ncbi:CIC family chloride channel protein [Ignavibacterium album JCM 16511]|uniref:CIC family chloride channel protein n=1 Tax=Ignavibacterium album (strain DSM 19864 / JCM 16511 / NBRC 101810 / Mat9-16) TaxID=945713 RepID=I0AJX5_IGNAJ|nr:chloride channel protein [Ignavibacterium album]AFH49282.1 CIC family chloride channel protein [Ignavibacterium album JCM 16511]
MTDYAVFSLFSVIIGIAAGFSAVIFHNAIEFFNKVFFEQTKEGLFFLGSAAVILLPAIGMFIQALMIKFAPDESKRRGVYEVVKAVATKGGNIKFRTTLFHFFAPVISIGSGVTLGPEGPAAQLGGGVASKISSIISLNDERKRIFTAAGAGAAIAAIFNTPLAGVFFTLEIILLNDFHTPTFSALIIASVSASTISRIFLGNESIFLFHIFEPIKYSHLHFYALIGVLAGIVSILFIRLDDSFKILFNKIYKKVNSKIFVMVIVGLIIGISGYFYKEIFGIGYKAINEILSNQLSVQVVLIIFLLKFILVPLATNAGAFGGLFAPSLFLGASFGYLVHYLLLNFVGINLDLSSVILISMGATLGGIHTIPITAIMMIFEMTQDYSFILPLMLAVISSTLLVQIAIKGTVHKRKLENEGYSFQQNDNYSVLNEIKIEEISLKEIHLVNENTNLTAIVSSFLEMPENVLYVIDQNKKLVGFIQEKEIRPILNDFEIVKDVLVAKDISNPKLICIDSKSNLDDALRLMMKYNLSEIPVLDKSAEIEEILGILTLQDIQSILTKESFKNQFTSSLATELKTLQTRQSMKVSDEYSIKEIKVPDSLVGKTLSETRIRNKYNIEVLMIKKNQTSIDGINKQNIITAEPNYKFESEDELVLFGKDENLLKFEIELKS